MKIIVLVLLAGLVGCAQFRDTVGCYEHLDLGLGYGHSFQDSSFNGTSAGDEHGNDKNHGASSWSGSVKDEDRIDVDVTLRFAPGSCQ